jgi:hypothetical protein
MDGFDDAPFDPGFVPHFAHDDFPSDDMFEDFEGYVLPSGVPDYLPNHELSRPLCSLTGSDLVSYAVHVSNAASCLSPYSVDFEPPDIPYPIAHPVPTRACRGAQTGINAAFVGALALYDRTSPRVSNRRVLIVGCARGASVYSLCAQVGGSYEVTAIDSSDRETLLRDAHGHFNGPGKPASISSFSAFVENYCSDDFPQSSCLVGPFDLIITVTNVHVLPEANLLFLVGLLGHSGRLIGVYPDARVAHSLVDCVGFEFDGLEGNKARVRIFGRPYIDPPFDCPVLPSGHYVVDVSHNEFCHHKPWNKLIPARMRDYSYASITKYYRVLSIVRDRLEVPKVPQRIVASDFKAGGSIPRMLSYAILDDSLDRAVSATYFDCSHLCSSKYYYKEKFDGLPRLLVVDHLSIVLYDPMSHETLVYRGPTISLSVNRNVEVIYQYELVGDTLFLCSVNAIMQNNIALPINFEARQRLYDPSWFMREWTPLRLLSLPIPDDWEGIVMCSATAAAVSYRHHVLESDSDPHYHRVGASLWIKAIPTVDCHGSDGLTYEVPMRSFMGSEAIPSNLCRNRGKKPPNDSVRLDQLSCSLPLEALAMFSKVNGMCLPPLEPLSKTAAEICDELVAGKPGFLSGNRHFVWGRSVPLPTVYTLSSVEERMGGYQYNPVTGFMDEFTLSEEVDLFPTIYESSLDDDGLSTTSDFLSPLVPVRVKSELRDQFVPVHSCERDVEHVD